MNRGAKGALIVGAVVAVPVLGFLGWVAYVKVRARLGGTQCVTC